MKPTILFAVMALSGCAKEYVPTEIDRLNEAAARSYINRTYGTTLPKVVSSTDPLLSTQKEFVVGLDLAYFRQLRVQTRRGLSDPLSMEIISEKKGNEESYCLTYRANYGAAGIQVSKAVMHSLFGGYQVTEDRKYVSKLCGE